MTKTPMRRCAACRKRAEKYELLRVVKIGTELYLDVEFKKEGRGAYLHKEMRCAIKSAVPGFWDRCFKKSEDKVGKQTAKNFVDRLIELAN